MIRTEANRIEVHGNAPETPFTPDFRVPEVFLTDERLEVSYSTTYGFRTVVKASIVRTNDGATVVGAHATFDREVTADLGFEPVEVEDARLALLDAAARVDSLTAEFIVPQVLRALVLRELDA